MLYNFNTESLDRARAALILYAVYRSRDANSPINGLETWDRFVSSIKGACLKSTNTAEFLSHFTKLCGVKSVKPRYLKTDGVVAMSDGSYIQSDGIKDYKTEILEDDTLLPLFEREGMLLTMLVRERIQREKIEGIEEADNEDEN